MSVSAWINPNQEGAESADSRHLSPTASRHPYLGQGTAKWNISIVFNSAVRSELLMKCHKHWDCLLEQEHYVASSTVFNGNSTKYIWGLVGTIPIFCKWVMAINVDMTDIVVGVWSVVSYLYWHFTQESITQTICNPERKVLMKGSGVEKWDFLWSLVSLAELS